MFMCTRGDEIGRIIDQRDRASMPSFANFSKKSVDELVGLLKTAFAKQREELIAHEGEHAPGIKELGKELKRLDKVDVRAAEKEARKSRLECFKTAEPAAAAAADAT